MNLRQAAQQALEALEEMWQSDKAQSAIIALKQALAEPEQEMTKQKPVAWTDGRGFIAYKADSFPRGTTVSPLYAHPPTPREASSSFTKPMTFKPLTDEEIWKFWWSRPEVPEGEDDSMEAEFVAAVKRVLAAHGIGEQT